MSTEELEPDVDDVLQVEADVPAVKVCMEGPTRVQPLPTKSAGIRGLTVGDSSARQLLTGDPHRARATVITDDVAVHVAASKQEVEGGQPGRIPPNTVVEFGATDELWAMADTGTAIVTVIQERWANG